MINLAVNVQLFCSDLQLLHAGESLEELRNVHRHSKAQRWSKYYYHHNYYTYTTLIPKLLNFSKVNVSSCSSRLKFQTCFQG